MRPHLAGFILTGVTLLFVGCNAAPPPAAAPAAPALPPPVLTINAEMVSLVDHAAHALWDVEPQGKAPKSDADWLELEDHAVQLAAAGTLISLGGTGPADAGWAALPDWKNFSRSLTDKALVARTAAQGKNFDALVKANGDIVEVCEACHKQFKPTLPTEGIIHRHRS